MRLFLFQSYVIEDALIIADAGSTSVFAVSEYICSDGSHVDDGHASPASAARQFSLVCGIADFFQLYRHVAFAASPPMLSPIRHR